MIKASLAFASIALVAISLADPITAQDTPWTEDFTIAVQRCWMPPTNASGIAVVLDVELGPDGKVNRVDGDPELVETKSEEIAFNAAQRAVLRCAPYTMLPADRYEDWQHMRINFDAAF